jgi:hypothetical protein
MAGRKSDAWLILRSERERGFIIAAGCIHALSAPEALAARALFIIYARARVLCVRENISLPRRQIYISLSIHVVAAGRVFMRADGTDRIRKRASKS